MMNPPSRQHPGADRGRMVLDAYDADPDGDRLYRLLVDLAHFAHEQGTDFDFVSACASRDAFRQREQRRTSG